ncbi:hypothetical protein SRHO_G00333340 [Serrasalmus rhombeus]
MLGQERVIEHLKEQREREEREKHEEVEAYKKENKEMKDKITSLQAQLLDKENPLQGKSAALEAEEAARRNLELSERLKLLEKEVAFHKEESGKSKAEVDRLLSILRDVESERTEKDNKISELERQAKEQNKKLASAKPTQLGEMKPSDGPPQLEELMAALEKTRQELDVTKQRLSTTQISLSERENHLTSMRQERRKQLEEILEMKQQALLAAISEKDANIALLELSASKKKTSQEEVMALKREKDRLMYQLKQQVMHCLWFTDTPVPLTINHWLN